MSDLQDLIHTNAKIAYFQGFMHKEEQVVNIIKENLAEGENRDQLIELIRNKENWK
jgi:hypothetical protein